MMKNILNPENLSGAMLSGGGRNPKDQTKKTFNPVL